MEMKWVAEAPFCEENYDDKWWEFIIIVRVHTQNDSENRARKIRGE